MMSHPILVRLPSRRTTPRATLELLPLAALVATSVAANAQEPSPQRTWSIEPSVSIGETITNNHNLQPVKRADAITEATAGIRVAGNGARLKGFLEYSLTGVAFARHSEQNEFRNDLRTLATAELIDRRAFVDMRGSITQQSISAFGTQSQDPTLANANRTEVANVWLSPYLRGKLGSFAEYEARLSHEVTRTDAAAASDVTNSEGSLHLDGGSRVFGWTADVSRHVADFSLGRRTEETWARAGLRYLFVNELLIAVTAGREQNNLVSLDKQSHSTWGVQSTWTPSPRTSISAAYDHRFFGGAHSFTFAHRTPRTVWTASHSRGVVTARGEAFGGNFALGTPYDLYFRQFASIEPDLVRRDVLVRDFLRTNGIDPNATVIGGFLASAATLESTQSVSFGLVGLRNTLTFRATQNKSRRLDTAVLVLDDFAASSEVRQRGLVIDLAHRLTPSATVTLTGSYQKTTGDVATQATELKSIIAAWTGQLSARSDLIAGARYVVFDSIVSPYNESAVFATYRMRF